MRSNAPAGAAPISALMRQAFEGHRISEVKEPTMSRSSSPGSISAASSAFRMASHSRLKAPSPAARSQILRSRMPVRFTIHSSDVSTIASRSALVNTPAGNEEPVPAIRTPEGRWHGHPVSTSTAHNRSLMLSLTWALTYMVARRIAFVIVRALLDPWQMRQRPLTPRRGAPPYSW